MNKQSLLYMSLSLCLGCILLRETTVELAPLSTPGPPPSSYEQTLIHQIDPPAGGYFYCLHLMHAGDLHGQHTPLDEYNFDHVIAWLDVAHTLLPESQVAPFLATFYFSNTHHPSAIYKLISFLRSYAKRNLQKRWRWYVYGIYLARHHLRDLT